MANRDPPLKSSSRPAAVNFIDNQLPKYHPAFINSSSHYDAEDGIYIPNNQCTVQSDNRDDASMNESSTSPDYGILSPRPSWTNTEALESWNAIFPVALNKLISISQEPSGRSKTEYSIRQGKSDWNAVYNTLENARVKYEQSSKMAGLVRKSGENITPVAQILKLASNIDPGTPFSTPVLGAVGIFLDVRYKHEYVLVVC
jgi:hypothetical protein